MERRPVDLIENDVYIFISIEKVEESNDPI